MADQSAFQYEQADDSSGFLLWKITMLWQQKLFKVLGEFGITQTQYAILASLLWFEERHEPATQAHLVEHTKIDKMTVSKSIRRLEVAGFVLRTRSAADARALDVEFTAFGKEQIRTAIVAVESEDEKFFSCLTTAQRNAYRSLTISIITGNNV
jgi:MarR family transcriptional regulator, transcriptional regulator for hemolysin